MNSQTLAPRMRRMGDITDTAPALSREATQLIRWGWIVMLAFFGVFFVWGAFVRLDAAAHATGTIAVSGSRQTVQHRDGGIVRAIRVKEGQHVRAGQVLIELAAGEVVANERSLSAQTIRLRAERARLIAEESGGAIATPVEFAELSGQDRIDADQAMALQRSEIRSRQASLIAQKRVLVQQAAELRQQIGGYRERMTFNDHQDRLFADELTGLRSLSAKGFVSQNRVRQTERAKADMEGQTASLAASAAAAREDIGEKRMQSMTLDSQQREKISQELRDVEGQLNEVLPKYRAAHQQLADTQIRATASGQVVGLKVFTVGGIIPPGQTLMEIVPDRAALVIDAQFTPDDADDLAVGQQAEVRITAMHDRGAPILMGTVTRVSADSFKDERTERPYYTATVSVPASGLAALEAHAGKTNALKPGLPAEVLVPLRRRTMLQYLLEPIDQAGWHSLREH